MSSTNSAATATSRTTALRRVTIRFQDDEVRRQSEATAHQLLSAAASDANANDNNAEMAKKALKYRKILERMAGVDITAPDFDASKFLGVAWCKIEDLKEYCAGREHQSKADGSGQSRDDEE